MTEVFMVNYAHTSNLKDWHCQLATESLMIAKETAQRLRVHGFSVRVQSVLVGTRGQVEIDLEKLN